MIIQTKRLNIELLSISDASFIVELLNSPGWLEFIGDRGVKTEEDAIKYIQNGPHKDFENMGHSLFKVVLNETGLPIGMCGLLKRDFLDHPDIGFAFLGEHNGKGYGAESSFAVLEWAKEKLGITQVMAITSPTNKKSIGLLEKLGLHYEKMVQYPGGDSVCLYSN